MFVNGRWVRTYDYFYERNGTEVCVEYSISEYDPGVSSGPPESCYPPEGGEVEIWKVTDEAGAEIKLSAEEDEALCQEISEKHDHGAYDYDPDWDR